MGDNAQPAPAPATSPPGVVNTTPDPRAGMLRGMLNSGMLSGNTGGVLPNNPTGPGTLGIPPGFNRSYKFPPGTFKD